MSSLIEDYALIGDCKTARLVSWEEFRSSDSIYQTAATHKT